MTQALDRYGIKPDVNQIFFDDVTHAADTLSSAINWGVAGGCPLVAFYFDVKAIAGSDDIEFWECATEGGSYTQLKPVLKGITATGKYVMILDNTINTLQFLKVKNNVTMTSGQSVNMNGWYHTIQ